MFKMVLHKDIFTPIKSGSKSKHSKTIKQSKRSENAYFYQRKSSLSLPLFLSVNGPDMADNHNSLFSTKFWHFGKNYLKVNFTDRNKLNSWHKSIQDGASQI